MQETSPSGNCKSCPQHLVCQGESRKLSAVDLDRTGGMVKCTIFPTRRGGNTCREPFIEHSCHRQSQCLVAPSLARPRSCRGSPPGHLASNLRGRRPHSLPRHILSHTCYTRFRWRCWTCWASLQRMAPGTGHLVAPCF